MQAVVIDVFDAEAYLSLQDGSNVCVGLTRLPSSLKVGSTVNLQVSSTQMLNHKSSSLIL